ncbi:chalcone/stilbene synthase family protein [Actinomyces denticolens]|nr:chalcone/stilbene synthase family protein [Actinomyces denticolens]
MSDASGCPSPEPPATGGGAIRPGRLGVGIISAGRVGAVLGSALRAVEHQVVGVHAVSQASRERAEMLLPGVPVLEVEQIVERAELVLLAVPDDALGPSSRAWPTCAAGSPASSSSTLRARTASPSSSPRASAGPSPWRSTPP